MLRLATEPREDLGGGLRLAQDLGGGLTLGAVACVPPTSHRSRFQISDSHRGVQEPRLWLDPERPTGLRGRSRMMGWCLHGV